jgi:hypothetical protein
MERFRFVWQRSIMTLIKDVFFVNNDDVEEGKLISLFSIASVSPRSCNTLLSSYKKKLSDSQGLDNTSLDEEQTCVTMTSTWKRQASMPS